MALTADKERIVGRAIDARRVIRNQPASAMKSGGTKSVEVAIVGRELFRWMTTRRFK